jgi:membrane-associated phospholipid phosphatase
MLTDHLWLAGLVVGKLCYFPLNYRTCRYYFKLPIDNKVPLWPIWIVPYSFYFIYLLSGAIWFWQTDQRHNYLVVYVLTTLLAGLFWYFFPNGVKRPDASYLKPSWSAKAIQNLYKHDKDGNGFPSAHVYATLITSWFFYLTLPQFWPIWLAIGLAISLSTIFTKQHYVVDVLGGIVWAGAGIWLGTNLGL